MVKALHKNRVEIDKIVRPQNYSTGLFGIYEREKIFNGEAQPFSVSWRLIGRNFRNELEAVEHLKDF